MDYWIKGRDRFGLCSGCHRGNYDSGKLGRQRAIIGLSGFAGYIISGLGLPVVSDVILRHIVGLINIEKEYGAEAFVRACITGTELPEVADAIFILRVIVGLEAF